MQSVEWIFGKHTVFAALQAQQHKVQEILCIKTMFDEINAQVLQHAPNCKIQVVDKAKLEQMVSSPQHQGVIAKAPCLEPRSEQELLAWCDKTEKVPAILILDGIQDPHNLGACIRSAAAFGVDWIVTPKDNAVGLKPSVRKIACGMEHFVPWAQVTNLARCIEQLKKRNIWVYAASADGSSSIAQMDWKGPVALVFGAEGKGVRPLVLKQCDGHFHIPMQPHAESFNVSVATAISLYEMSRQRG